MKQNLRKQSIPICLHFTKQKKVIFMITFIKKKSIIKTIHFRNTILLPALAE